MDPEQKREVLTEPVIKSEAQTDKNSISQAKTVGEPDGRKEAKKGGDTKTKDVWKER